MPSSRNGPGAFLVSVGIVLAFLGLMTFLAIPAAKELDMRESVEDGTTPVYTRQVTVVRGAGTTTGVGAAMVVVGWVMIRKRR